MRPIRRQPMSDGRARRRSHARLPGTLRQAEQIVRLLTVGFRFQILVAETADCHDDTHGVATTVHMKRPLAAFNARDGLGSAEAPALSVWVDAADTKNPLMRIVAIAFVDTFDLVAHMPCSCCCGARPPLARPRHVAASRSQGMRPSKSIVETLKMA